MAFFPPPLTPSKPTPKGLWRRTPPAIFPPTLGLLGLALGWRQGAAEFGLPLGLADAFLGAVTLLASFVVLSYLVKLMRRPAVALDDLRLLPGRAGLGAGVLCLYLLAAALTPWAPEEARPLLVLGLALHILLCAAMVWLALTGTTEMRRVNPAWHLVFSGVVVAGLVALPLGLMGLAVALFWLALAAALAIWMISLQQFARQSVPAPLRPLLAIHLAPAALLGTLAGRLEAGGAAQAFAILSALMLAVLVARGPWLLASGFSAFWGALVFPLAATASFWLGLGGAWQIAGGIVLFVATMAGLPLAFHLFKMWAKGELALKTGAAIA